RICPNWARISLKSALRSSETSSSNGRLLELQSSDQPCLIHYRLSVNGLNQLGAATTTPRYPTMSRRRGAAVQIAQPSVRPGTCAPKARTHAQAFRYADLSVQ